MDPKGVLILPVDKLTFSFNESSRTVSTSLTVQNLTDDRISYKLKGNVAKFKKTIAARPGACGFVEPHSEAVIKVSINPLTFHLERLHFVVLWAKASEECQDPKAFWKGISKDKCSWKLLKCVFKLNKPDSKVAEESGHEELLLDVTEVLESLPQKSEPLIVKLVDNSSQFNLSFSAQVLIVAVIGVILGQIFFP